MYYFLDLFFIAFHSLLIVFNLTGWIWQRTRRWHLISLSLTALSWFGLGIWYGLGYCPFTQWHWQVRIKLGYYDMPYSYIKFLLDLLTGCDWDAGLVDILTGTLFTMTFLISLVLNIKPYLDKRS